MRAKMLAKGRVVIPAALRKKYGLLPGPNLSVVDHGGVLALVPELADPVTEAAGMLKGGASLTQALRAERRAERRRQERQTSHRGPRHE